MKISKVLVAVDFSPPSTLAVNCGIAFARKFHARLSLLHVIEPTPAFFYALPTDPQIEQERTEQAYRMLSAMVSSEDQDDLDARFVVRAGEIQDVIESVVHEEEPDLVVMGTHGRGLLKRLLLGSVTQGLLRKLGVPVLTVCHVTRPLEFKRLLVATDFGVDADKAFRFALELAEATRASLVVAHTLERRPDLTYEAPGLGEAIDEARREAVKQAQERFSEYRADGARQSVSVECVLSDDADVAESLVTTADQNDVDFIILGLREKTLVDRVLLGSTAEPLIRAAHVPVLSFPIDTKVTVVEDASVASGGKQR